MPVYADFSPSAQSAQVAASTFQGGVQTMQGLVRAAFERFSTRTQLDQGQQRINLDAARLAEQSRQFNVGTQVDAARLREQGRQFDIGTTERARQFNVNSDRANRQLSLSQRQLALSEKQAASVESQRSWERNAAEEAVARLEQDRQELSSFYKQFTGQDIPPEALDKFGSQLIQERMRETTAHQRDADMATATNLITMLREAEASGSRVAVFRAQSQINELGPQLAGRLSGLQGNPAAQALAGFLTTSMTLGSPTEAAEVQARILSASTFEELQEVAKSPEFSRALRYNGDSISNAYNLARQTLQAQSRSSGSSNNDLSVLQRRLPTSLAVLSSTSRRGGSAENKEKAAAEVALYEIRSQTKIPELDAQSRALVDAYKMKLAGTSMEYLDYIPKDASIAESSALFGSHRAGNDLTGHTQQP